MESSNNSENRFDKSGLDKAIEFVKKHVRYFTAGALFAVLVLVLVFWVSPEKKSGELAENPTETVEVTEETEEPYQVDAYTQVNELVTNYYTAYAAGDIETLFSFAVPISENEQSYIKLFSQYVDGYQNIKCYTKSGLDANSYLVSVSMEVKFAGVDTAAPGLDFFFVRTNEETGALYIDNLYSQYNLANQENALDTSVQNLIYKFENESDVIALQKEVQTRYDNAIASDENLSNMISSTIPNAITDWVTTMVSQTTETSEQTSTETSEETAEETSETPEEAEASEETPEEQPVSETLTATDRVNVRASADTASEKLGTVEVGQTVTRTGTEGDWSIIEFNGTKGYIKSEYLTADASSVNTGSEASSGGITEGTTITLQSSTNIRSGMSETSDKVGTAYAGEKVKVIMSYAEGWTKVSWNGKTGYIKTSLLQ